MLDTGVGQTPTEVLEVPNPIRGLATEAAIEMFKGLPADQMVRALNDGADPDIYSDVYITMAITRYALSSDEPTEQGVVVRHGTQAVQVAALRLLKSARDIDPAVALNLISLALDSDDPVVLNEARYAINFRSDANGTDRILMLRELADKQEQVAHRARAAEHAMSQRRNLIGGV